MRDVIIAELESPDAAVLAARRARELGFHRIEAYTPFPIPELDDMLAIRRTRVPWIILIAGFTGGALGLLLLWWTNAWDYPINVGRRPLFSAPADMPIVFESTVLVASLTAFVAALVVGRMPQLHDPLFDLPGFGRTRSDRFWIVVDDAAFMEGDVAVAEDEDDERRARLLRSIQDDKLAELSSAFESIGASVKRSPFDGELR